MKSYLCYQALLLALPLHAEEGGLREDLSESVIILQVIANGGDPTPTAVTVAVVRRLFDSLVLLDPIALAQDRWAFVSFPASLLARSILETMATPGKTFFLPDYWEQESGRSSEVIEEQRNLLHRLESQRTFDPNIKANPIRTVHVSWGLLRFGSDYLLHRREDKNRGDVPQYVLPGGRLKPADLPRESLSPKALRDLFQVNSVMANSALRRTLERELFEELKLAPSDYVATYEKTLSPFCKVEGALNNHAYTQYNIAIFSIKLNETGMRSTLNLIAQQPTEWQWFSAQELVAGKRADGKRAYVDALVREPLHDILKFLQKSIPDSCTPATYQSDETAIALPSASNGYIGYGAAGAKKQKKVSMAIDQRDWELLMLLGWHARGLKVDVVRGGLLVLLGGGWIKLLDKELLEIAAKLARKLRDSELPLVECDSIGICRLSILKQHLYFQPECFEYFWDFESDEKPVILTLKQIETRWAILKKQDTSIQLTDMLIKAMPDLQDGRETEADPADIRRTFGEKLALAKSLGLRQFVATKNGAQEILVKKLTAGRS